MEANGMAGHVVHVNGLNTKLFNGDPLSTTYSWDFGDPAGRFNTLVGWNAAHVYDKPGTYTVTLTVTDSAGKTATAKGTVKIAADTRQKIYVDAQTGSDTNNGSSPTKAVASLAAASKLLNDNTELLLRRGQTFNVTDTIGLSFANLLIDAYGSGAAPIVNKVLGGGQSIFNVFGAADGILVQNIAFQTQWGLTSKYGDQKLGARAFLVAGTNFAVRNCSFDNLDDGVNTAGQPDGVLVQDCNFGMGMRGCGIWAEGYDHVYLGNTMVNSTREHLIRSSGSGVHRVLIEDNNLSRPTNAKGSLELRTASWFYVRGNRIDGGTLRVGLPDGVTPTDTRWGVVEGNETFKFFINIRPGVQHLAFRDNVIHYDDGAMIIMETETALVPRTTSDIRIDHNTAMSESNVGKFLKIDGPAVNVAVTNNLFVAPNIQWVGEESGAVFVAGANLGDFSEISNNIWPKMPSNSLQPGDNYLWPAWGDIKDGFQTAQQWSAQPQVHNEQYANADLSGDVYDMTLNGTTAGALPSVFNPNAYKMAA
jgi:PKD repeat protein